MTCLSLTLKRVKLSKSFQAHQNKYAGHTQIKNPLKIGELTSKSMLMCELTVVNSLYKNSEHADTFSTVRFYALSQVSLGITMTTVDDSDADGY